MVKKVDKTIYNARSQWFSFSWDPEQYDLVGVFRDLPEVDWTQYCKARVGDLILIYANRKHKTSPSRFLAVLKVIKANVPYSQKIPDDAYWIGPKILPSAHYVRTVFVRWLSEEQQSKLTKELLIKHGMKRLFYRGQTLLEGACFQYVYNVIGK
jgi:hypothetical protein